jgi:hypothetical protein
MSVLGQKADIAATSANVRFAPENGHRLRRSNSGSFFHVCRDPPRLIA